SPFAVANPCARRVKLGAPGPKRAHDATKVCSGEAGWTARLLDANECYVDTQRLREEEDRLGSRDWGRQDPGDLGCRPGTRRVAERAVLDVSRISRMPVRVARRRGNRQIAPADREGKSLSARGQEAGRNQPTQHPGDQQGAGHELAPTAIEQSRAHGVCLGAGVYLVNHVPATRRHPTARYCNTRPSVRCAARALRKIASGVATLMSIDWLTR